MTSNCLSRMSGLVPRRLPPHPSAWGPTKSATCCSGRWIASQPSSTTVHSHTHPSHITPHTHTLQVKQGGNKPTKLFGRQYLLATGVWGSVSSSVRADLKAQEVSPGLIDLVVGAWESSIGEWVDGEVSGTSSEAHTEQTSNSRPPSAEAELVWAANFQQVLKQRREERKAEVRAANATDHAHITCCLQVRARNVRMDENETAHEALKTLVQEQSELGSS